MGWVPKSYVLVLSLSREASKILSIQTGYARHLCYDRYVGYVLATRVSIFLAFEYGRHD
jgi:hypothetical protein